MTAFFTSAQRPWLFGLASIVLTLLSSIWFAMCFMAREQAWWNSIYWFMGFYAAAAILALRGIRSILGVLALLFALAPLGLICILAIGR